MQRFFVEFPLVDTLDIIDDDMVHQIGRVLRARIGDMIILFCGDGTESRYEILSISKKSISLKRMEVIVRDVSPSQKITLMQAFPNKYEKIEYIIQK
jgi:RsmE family RNA methyltransferase